MIDDTEHSPISPEELDRLVTDGLSSLSPEEAEAVFSDSRLAAMLRLTSESFYGFRPRPDWTEVAGEEDQQTSAYESKAPITFILGGNGCLAGESRIYDPVANIHREIGVQREEFHVVCRRPDGNQMVGRALPWLKGVADLYRVTTANGDSFIVTLSHRLLTPAGWRRLASLRVGDRVLAAPPSRRPRRSGLFLPRSIAGICRGACRQDGVRSSRKRSGSTGRCSQGRHPCDARLLLPSNSGREFVRQQGGALERSRGRLTWDDFCTSREHTQTCQRSAPLSTAHSLPLGTLGLALQSRASCTPCLPPWRTGSIHGPDLQSSAVATQPSTEQRRSPPCSGIAVRTFLASRQPATGQEISPSDSLDRWNGSFNSTHITAIEFVRQDEFFDIEVTPFPNYAYAGVWHHNSGKTETAGAKFSRFLLTKKPPRKDTPAWVISDTYEQCMNICWKEKLRKYIPDWMIDYPRARWKSSAQDWPYIIPLQPDRETGHNWQIEFRSYDQGRRQFQGRSIGAFWFSEQFPRDLLVEVLRGCRDYWRDYHGGRICEFTPADPDMSLEFEGLEENPPKGWKIFYLNSDRNTAVDADFRETFFQGISDEMMATRKFGCFASFEGAIFKTFSSERHTLKTALFEFPPNCRHFRAIDWGESRDHPFACVWFYVDGAGHVWVYDSYLEGSGTKITQDHVAEIKGRWGPEQGIEFAATFGDPFGPGEINEFSFRGIPTQSARNSLDGGIECLRVHFKNATIHIDSERCATLIKQIRKYRWRRASANSLNPAAPIREPLRKENDLVDALRYGVYSAQMHDSGGFGRSKTSDSEDFLERHGIQLDGLDHTRREWWRGVIAASDDED